MATQEYIKKLNSGDFTSGLGEILCENFEKIFGQFSVWIMIV